MNLDRALIDAMFTLYGVRGPWEPLLATGLANRIYATQDVVLRVSTDHPDGVVDARTESVAAPVARAAGILTPRLIAFDDSRTLVDRPFSLWERVDGDTLGLIELDHRQMVDAWRDVGRELSRLHHRIRECPDPQGYLDEPGRDLDLDRYLKRLVDAKRVDEVMARAIDGLLDELASHVTVNVDARFLHNDVHSMNLMWSAAGALRAIIDWGDAGWGDPTLDFAAIPLDAMPYALEGYRTETPSDLGDFPEARFIWDKLHGAIEDAWETPGCSPPLEAFRQFLRSTVG